MVLSLPSYQYLAVSRRY